MLKHFILLAFLFFSALSFAQKADSFFVVSDKGGWLLKHKVKNGDNVMNIARRYYAPPAMFTDANKISFQQELLPGSFVKVPLGAYNFLNDKPQTIDARPVYFINGNEGLHKIARISGVTQKQLQEWNGLSTSEIRKGQIIQVGWVRYDYTPAKIHTPAKETENSGIKIEQEDSWSRPRSHTTTQTIIIPLPDTTATDTLSEGEKQYLAQTQNGEMITEEKGTAAFFKRAGRSENGIYFAFHNLARRGSIIKIYNPGHDKTVYAKVIGKLPVNGTFYNTILGISSDAKAALGTMAEKLWVEISYAP